MIAICHHLLHRIEQALLPARQRKRCLYLPCSEDPRRDDPYLDFGVFGRMQVIRVRSDERR